jgi:NAD(P)-dependent dehydrogenase (short-subunit alcohol dehydrogenase family)
MRLEAGQVAVVTGAASGIGRALADAFAREGLHLVLADLDDSGLERAATELVGRSCEVLTVPTDVADAGAVDALAHAAVERFGEVHVVCNNAGVGGWGARSWEQPAEVWDWVLRVNVMGVVHGVRAFTPLLLERGDGHIVNTASLAGLAVVPHLGPYSASKHAVVALSTVLHHELAATGAAVGVSVLCPGFTRTGILAPDRYWPAKLGPTPRHADDAGTRFVHAAFEQGIEHGGDPAHVAELTLDAVRTDRFLVTTDLAFVEHALVARAGVVDGAPPPLLPVG